MVCCIGYIVGIIGRTGDLFNLSFDVFGGNNSWTDCYVNWLASRT